MSGSTRLGLLIIVATSLSVAGSAFAFVRQELGDKPLRWALDTISFTVRAGGDEAITDGSDETAVRLAFQAWEIPESRLRFRESLDPAGRARSDWRSNDIHMVVWDETNESGLFGGASGLVAATPLDFDVTTGEIVDADIILNGQRLFSTTLESGRFDVQAIVTHEVGHFLGLDHSAVEGATMMPRSTFADTTLRTLEADDRAAVASVYPAYGASARIAGELRIGGRAISGAHVVAEDERGEPVSATISNASGRFIIEGLPAGSYAVYAQPLNGNVRAQNLQLQIRGQTVDTEFGTTFWGAGGRSSAANPQRVMVASGQAVQLSTISALPANDMRLRSLSAALVHVGERARIVVYGSGLSGTEGVAIPTQSPGELALSNERVRSGYVSFDLDVASAASLGLRSIRVYRNSDGASAVLTGRLEVRLAAPQVQALSSGDATPGESLELLGSGFQPGAQVFVGPAVVTASGAGDRLVISVPRVPNGTYDVIVGNPDGQLTKLRHGLTVSGSTAAPPPAPPPSTSPAPQGSAPAPVSSGGGGGGGGCSLMSANDGAPWSVAVFALMMLGALALRRSQPPASAAGWSASFQGS